MRHIYKKKRRYLAVLTLLTGTVTFASPVSVLDDAIQKEKSKPKLNVTLKVKKEQKTDDLKNFEVIQSSSYIESDCLRLLADNKNNDLSYCINPILEVAESREDAYFIAAVMILESDWGRSRICKDKHNYFAYRAYDRSPYDSAKPYDGFEESLADFVMLMNTYEVKYELYTIEEKGSRYCSSPSWATQVRDLMNKLREYDNKGGS